MIIKQFTDSATYGGTLFLKNDHMKNDLWIHKLQCFCSVSSFMLDPPSSLTCASPAIWWDQDFREILPASVWMKWQNKCVVCYYVIVLCWTNPFPFFSLSSSMLPSHHLLILPPTKVNAISFFFFILVQTAGCASWYRLDLAGCPCLWSPLLRRTLSGTLFWRGCPLLCVRACWLISCIGVGGSHPCLSSLAAFCPHWSRLKVGGGVGRENTLQFMSITPTQASGLTCVNWSTSVSVCVCFWWRCPYISQLCCFGFDMLPLYFCWRGVTWRLIVHFHHPNGIVTVFILFFKSIKIVELVVALSWCVSRQFRPCWLRFHFE